MTAKNEREREREREREAERERGAAEERERGGEKSQHQKRSYSRSHISAVPDQRPLDRALSMEQTTLDDVLSRFL